MKSLGTLLFFLFCSLAQAEVKEEQLYNAVVKQDTTTILKLIKSGTNINYEKTTGPWFKANLLTTAINQNPPNIRVIGILLENGINVNWKDGFQTTALMYAASKGNKPLVELLLERGADLSAKDAQGNTVHSAAKESKNQELVAYIEKKMEDKKVKTAP